MKNINFSSIDYNLLEKLFSAKNAEELMSSFSEILKSLYFDDFFAKILRHPVADNFMAIFGMLYEPNFPTKGENLRFFPSAEVFNKFEKHFRIVEKYQGVLKKQKTPCGKAKVRRKIAKVDFKMSAQEFYSAVIYLFLHNEFGKIEDFKSMLAAG